MAHNLDTSNNRYNMAYRGEKPWHGLGFPIEAGDSSDVIAQKAGLTFQIKKAPVQFTTEDGYSILTPAKFNKSVLYRDDTNAPLSVMSTDKYHVVQPTEIVDFIASSAKAMGWEIETAGSINGGRKIWALANLGQEEEIGVGDRVKGYLLAATACDGSMASEFLFTSVRVVCDNTLHMAVAGEGGGLKGAKEGSQSRVKVYHFNKFDMGAVKESLGIAESIWANFIERAKVLSSVKLTDKKAVKILRSVYEKPQEGAPKIDDAQFLKENTAARKILELYQGQAIGADLRTAKDTAWGLVNAQTEFSDHASKTRSVDNRLNTAWFGRGAQLKQDIVDACFEMVG